MILRKPYAIFIKMFRPIHFIISFLLGIISYKFYNIYLFFKEYSKTGKFNYIEDITTYYVNSSLYTCIIALLFLFTLIIILFLYKRKSIVSYVVMLCSQLFCLFFSFLVKSNLIILDNTNIDIRVAIILRDISIILSVFNIFLLIWMAFRTLGFNLKQFEFNKDLKELQIENADSEEFEFSVDIDKNDIKTKWNKFKRLSRYYFIEYRKTIISILVFVIFLSLLLIFFIYLSKDIIYSENKVIDLDNYQYKFKVLNTYVLKNDYKGLELGEGKNKYVVIRFAITNKEKDGFVFNLSNAVLTTNKTYSNVINIYNSFRDIGVGYIGQQLKKDTTGEFIMVYPVDINDNSSEFILRVFEGKKKFSIKLNPQVFNNIHQNNSVNLNEELVITNSILPKITFKVIDYKIDSKIILKDKGLEYAIVPNSKDNTILLFKYNYQMNDSNIYKFSGKQFISSYVKLEIEKYGKIKTYDVINRTPSSISDYSALEVNKDIESADSILLKINIRNEEYYYYLKK